MQRRHFIYGLGILGATSACPNAATALAKTRKFTLPPLPYAYNALEPYIDARTMEFHHDKHHAAYVKNLNTALEKYPKLQDKSIEDLLRNIDSIPEAIRATIKNNGGGHANHTMYWEIMGPKAGGEPTGKLADEIVTTFSSFTAFQNAFNEAGTKRFGSGWAWLVRTKEGKLQVTSTANQDSPLMTGDYPIMGNDVWEHAYYLSYQNRRPEYLKAWWQVVNWSAVNQRYLAAG
jgi:superoxide dismutase, Fe-Mn family